MTELATDRACLEDRLTVIFQSAPPALPPGWHYEASDFDPALLHIVWPNHGAVSIHLKRRTAELGWCRPRLPARHAPRLAGRGWKQQLVDEAVTLLNNAWTTSR